MEDNKKQTIPNIGQSEFVRQQECEKLTEAVSLVQKEIRSCRERYQKIASGEDRSIGRVLIEGETESGFPCQLMVDAKTVAEIYLKYDFPVWATLEDDAPCEMWNEMARTFGISEVESADL